MPFITWTTKNKINIPMIDDQHKMLFDLLNRLHSAVSAGHEQGAIGTILDELIDYTVYHFNTEEEIFQQHEFPMLEEHQKEHNHLTQQALDLQTQFKKGSATISFEILDFLHDWLMDHTAGLDMEFGNFMRSREQHAS